MSSNSKKNMNVKVFNTMSGVNGTEILVQHEWCECKCKAKNITTSFP